MEIHQCMTCGERWGVGTSAAGLQAERHRLKGHTVRMGDDTVLRHDAEAVGLDITSTKGEPLSIYRCFECEEVWVHGSEDAYQRGAEHKGMGHLVLVGEDVSLRAMPRSAVADAPQTPNPLDPESVAGGGKVLSFGGGE